MRELEAKLDELKQTIESGVQLKGRIAQLYHDTVVVTAGSVFNTGSIDVTGYDSISVFIRPRNAHRYSVRAEFRTGSGGSPGITLHPNSASWITLLPSQSAERRYSERLKMLAPQVRIHVQNESDVDQEYLDIAVFGYSSGGDGA